MHANWRPEPGDILDGTYRIEASLGLTEVGERFEAVDTGDDSAVVVTVLHPALFQGKYRGPNILRVQRSRAFAHQNIVGLRDVVLAGGGDCFYVVNEVHLGTPLERWVLSRMPLDAEVRDAIVRQLVEALECVHLIGVHGNLNPANIYVDDDHNVLVGEPWFLEGTDAVEVGQIRERQAHWMAPEQRDGGWLESHETDVFLLGALVGWLLAGRAVVPGVSLISQQVEIPPGVDAVLLQATHERPEERFHDVRSFWDAFEAACLPLEQDVEADGVSDDDILAVVELEDAVGEPTEAIPLEEIAQMGLDVGLSADASHVDAIVILDEGEDADVLEVEDFEEVAAVPLVTDTSYIPMNQLTDNSDVVDAIVEVGIIDRDAEAEQVADGEERTIQVVPGPGSAKALEAARLAEARRREAVAEVVSSPTGQQSSEPSVRVRSRAIYVAPFLALLAGGAMFWVLGQVMGTESQTASTEFARPSAPSQAPARGSMKPVEAVAPPASQKSTADNVAPDKTSADATAADKGDVSTVTASASPGPDAVSPSSADAGAVAESKKADVMSAADAAVVAEAPTPAVPAVDPHADMESGDYRCPSGMAKIRSRRKVTLPDGKTKRRKVVWCADRFEYPGKGAVPTTNVTLGAAKSACRAKGRRLCRRSEWRGACGGAKFPYRGEYDPARCNTVAPGGIPRGVIAAGSKSRCKGVFGTYDMSGNVAEWTSDGTVNGGSAYKDGASATCYRSSRRTGGSPYVGFRCCADPQPVAPKPEKEPVGEAR